MSGRERAPAKQPDITDLWHNLVALGACADLLAEALNRDDENGAIYLAGTLQNEIAGLNTAYAAIVKRCR